MTGQRVRRREADGGSRDESVAEVASRCASLLRAGAAPARALELLAAHAPFDAPVAAIARRLGDAAPADAATAIAAEGEDPGWRVLAAAWQLGERSGAPIATALDRISDALRDVERLRERRAVLLAGPRSTIRLVTCLPPLALLLGWGLGFDPWGVLLSPIGAVLMALGIALLCAGYLWARAMTRRSEERDRPAGIGLELFGIALSGGADPATARLRVADAVDGLGVEWVEFSELCDSGPLMAAVRMAEEIGSPLRDALARAADDERRRAGSELERAAERLGIGVLVPLALCVLPSFIALGVLPVVIAMLGGVTA